MFYVLRVYFYSELVSLVCFLHKKGPTATTRGDWGCGGEQRFFHPKHTRLANVWHLRSEGLLLLLFVTP